MNGTISRTVLSLLMTFITVSLICVSSEERVRQEIVHYKKSITPGADTAPVRAWLKQYRTVYPLTHRPLPIALIDKLSAYDMRLIYELQRIAQQAGMLICRSHSFPTLTPAGNKLYALAEKLLASAH